MIKWDSWDLNQNILSFLLNKLSNDSAFFLNLWFLKLKNTLHQKSSVYQFKFLPFDLSSRDYNLSSLHEDRAIDENA